MAKAKPGKPSGIIRPRVYRIDQRGQQPYESGALLLTLLAFPKETADDQKFAELHCALCAAALTERARDDGPWSNAHQFIKPIHFALPPKQVAAALRTFNRRMRDRMIAGRIANAIIFNAAGLNPKLPKGCEGFSIKQLIRMALDDVGQLDAENAEQRIWRASLPVAHLAGAVQQYLNRKDNAAHEVSYGDILFNRRNAVGDIVRQATKSFNLMKDHPDRFKLGRKAPVVLLCV